MQTLPADFRVDISDQAARVVVQPVSTSDRRPKESDVPRRAKIHRHVFERPIVNAATTRTWRYEHGDIRSREREGNFAVRNRFTIARQRICGAIKQRSLSRVVAVSGPFPVSRGGGNAPLASARNLLINEPALTVGILDSCIRRGGLSRTARRNSDATPEIQTAKHQPCRSDEQPDQARHTLK